MIAPEEIWKALDEVFIAAGLQPIPQGTKWEEALPMLKELVETVKDLEDGRYE